MNKKENRYPNLEIISLHIAKTGGKSFVNLMKGIYGDDQATWFRRLKYKVDKRDWNPDLVKEAKCSRVLHGHFLYREIRHIHENSNAEVITWVRDPVERVISRYLYLQQRIEAEADHFQKEKRDMGLLEYASLPDQKNVMTQYLEGIPIEDLFFIGIFEQYDQSIRNFTQLLHITEDAVIPWDNNNKEYKSRFHISAEERQEIAVINQEDIALYKQVLMSRGV